VSILVSRALTFVAAGVLAFDGAALAALGFWSGRIVLALIGVAFFISSGLVLLYWRWYRRKMEDIHQSRQALGADVRELQRILRTGKR
jgi:membrane protein implicated in regulation of membrane protease activity